MFCFRSDGESDSGNEGKSDSEKKGESDLENKTRVDSAIALNIVGFRIENV
jgi:hypothetical protein